MKTCTKCNQTKPETSFHKDKYKPDGLRSQCVDCTREHDQKRYYSNVEESRKRVREHRKKIDPAVLKIQNRNQKLKRAYGLTFEEVEELKKAQNYCCAICGVHESKAGKKGLVVDHCHNTGAVRKLLCSSCNSALGLVKENTNVLAKMIEYLTKE